MIANARAAQAPRTVAKDSVSLAFSLASASTSFAAVDNVRESLRQADFPGVVIVQDEAAGITCRTVQGRKDCAVAGGGLLVSITRVRRLAGGAHEYGVTRRVVFNEEPDAEVRRVAGYESELYVALKGGTWVVTGSGPTKVF